MIPCDIHHEQHVECLMIESIKKKNERNFFSRNKEDQIDHSVGIVLKKHLGDTIDVDDVLCTLYVKNYDINYITGIELSAKVDKGRMHILGKMLEVIKAPRNDLSKFAPKIICFDKLFKCYVHHRT